MNFPPAYSRYLKLAEEALHHWMPPSDTRPARLHQAMHHSVFAGGKRLRPVLLLAAADAASPQVSASTSASASKPVGTPRPAVAIAQPAAAAIECLHCYSLIHDDLPSVDNSDVRRGLPTCHIAFDEATALLAGDALLTLAFEILSTAYADAPDLSSALVAELALAAGSRHLIGGQMEDILGEKRQLTGDDLAFIHANKTARLFTAALRMGLLCHGSPDPRALELAHTAGHQLGLAFQFIDDILDATATVGTLGKPTRQDAEVFKNTAVSLYGLDEATRMAESFTTQACAALRQLPGNPAFLIDLTQALRERIF